MRFCFVAAVAAVLGSTSLFAQMDAPDSAADISALQPPRLIASAKDWPSLGHCGKKRFQWARVLLDVAEDGSPLYLQSSDSSVPAVTEPAMHAVAADRFAPAQQDGKPVRVHGIMLVEMHTCTDKVKQPDGTKTEQVWLQEPPKQSFWVWRQVGVLTASAGQGRGRIASEVNGTAPAEPGGAYRVGRGISAPVPLTTPEAEFTNQSRKDRVQGLVMVTLIVDAHGMPQNLRILKPLPAGLSEAAIAAVQRYRFKPALKDGDKPVPVMITIVVNFKLY